MRKRAKPETKVFQHLRRKDGKEYDKSVFDNWYIARGYVLDKLKDVEIGPDSDQHLHAIVIDDQRDDLMLAVLRQVALSAHYANFDEGIVYEKGATIFKCKNRTVVTFVSDRPEVEKKLREEECLCNLLDYCWYSLYGAKHNENSYLDLELYVVSPDDYNINDKNAIVMKREEVSVFEKNKDVQTIDTRKAVYASRMYTLGDEIGNLPAEDIHNAHRYQKALDKFQYVKMEEKWKNLFDDNEPPQSLSEVKEIISNLFCSDCFESRKKGIEQSLKKEKQKKEGREKNLKEEEIWEKNNDALSRSEHARWMVEKYIMGYRRMNATERFTYERYTGKNRKNYAMGLKRRDKDPVHIDLCSYHDLRRINPDDMKYDSFLMLAIPKILEKIRKDDE